METFKKDQDLFDSNNDQLNEIENPDDSVIDSELDENATAKKTKGQEDFFEFYSKFMGKFSRLDKNKGLFIGQRISELKRKHQRFYQQICIIVLPKRLNQNKKEEMIALLKFIREVKKPENLNGHKNEITKIALKKDRNKLMNYWCKLEQAKAEIYQLKEALIGSCFALVVNIAGRYVNHGVDQKDLIQEGNIGLMRAADLYDYRRGYKFSTYAVWWIKQKCTRAIIMQGRGIRTPVHINEFANKIFKTTEKLRSKNDGIGPTIEEIAKDMEMPVHRVLNIFAALRTDPASLDMLIGSAQENKLADFISDKQKNQLESIENKELQENIDRILSCLTEKEKDIIKLRYGIGKHDTYTLEEIGQMYNRTRERIRQIEGKAIRKLKHPQRKKELSVFLSKAS